MKYDLSSASAASVAEATDAAIGDAEAFVAQAVSTAEAGYHARLEPLNRARDTIQDAMGYGPFLSHFHPDQEVRDAGHEAEQRMSTWMAELVARPEVYEAVANLDPESLEGVQRRSWEHWMRDLRRAGHGHSDDVRERVRSIQQRLVELQVRFQKNIAEYQDHLDVPVDELAALPPSYIAALDPGDAPGTVRVTLDYPSYFPFLEQVGNRELRRQLRHKYQNRAVTENRPLLEEAIALRAEIADLLDYADWAAYSMEPKMAEPAAVAALYDSVVPGLTALGRREKVALQALLEVDEPGAELAQWDWRYYHDLQRTRDYGVDQNEVAEYLALDAVIAGMLEVTGSVFGVTYAALPDEPTWHEDVRSFRIHDADSGEPLAVFHLDLHPREGKFTHAACWNPVVRRRMSDGSARRPVAAVAANFTRPTADTPALLTHDEALTLWHEFGHALHACLTEVEEQSFAGNETEWDFVEAPSQIMENWMWEAEVLRRFARHYRSGEPIPESLVSALVAARDQNVGLQTLRQVSLGQYDLLMHTSGTEPDLEALLRRSNEYSLLPLQPDTFMAASWGHPMGGYDAGYYGYLWAQVYGDDMYSVFEAEGVMSPEVGRRYRREVLAKGGSRDAIEHLRAFLGREPNADAFLRRLGIDGQD